MSHCAVRGCKRSVKARGWCGAHYSQWRASGALGPLRSELTTRGRFRAFVQKTDTCWMWTGATDRNGYGRFYLSPKDEFYAESGVLRQVGAHQFALAMKLGRWPQQQALHRCDTPGCVRQSHLYEGSNTDNMRDKVERGRVPRGESHGRARITEQDVLDLRSGTRTARQIAETRGVSMSAAYHAKNGRNWKSV